VFNFDNITDPHMFVGPCVCWVFRHVTEDSNHTVREKEGSARNHRTQQGIQVTYSCTGTVLPSCPEARARAVPSMQLAPWTSTRFAMVYSCSGNLLAEVCSRS
jgi:hypothetical protein